MNSEKEERSIIEQHISVILQIMVVGLLTWSLKTTLDLTGDVAVLKVQVQTLQALIQQATNDRYRAADADKDIARVYSDLKSLDARLGRIEAIETNHK